jgi:glycosyltransferase domain-containing protein
MKFEKISNCTLIIITHERKSHLKDSIKFYEKFFLTIKVLDSSVKKNQSIKQPIDYKHCPNFSLMKKVIYGLSNTVTEFVIISSDDDYFIPTSIKRAITFLQKNLEFVSLSGKYFSFEKVGIFKKFNLMYKNNYKSIIHNNPAERLKSVCSENMSQMTYNLFRTKKIYHAISKFKDFNQADFLEYSITLTSILFGKHKFYDVNWMIRDGSVNTAYGKDNTICSLIENNPQNKDFYINKFRLSYLKLLSDSKIYIDKKIIGEYFNNYFSRLSFFRSSKNKKLLFKKLLFYENLKKIYKIIKYIIFYYRCFVFFSDKERKIIKSIF